MGRHLRTTPFDQYFLGVGIFKKVSNRVELALKDQKVRTTPFDQYFLGIGKITLLIIIFTFKLKGGKYCIKIPILIEYFSNLKLN
jgi:hypothetical protein